MHAYIDLLPAIHNATDDLALIKLSNLIVDAHRRWRWCLCVLKVGANAKLGLGRARVMGVGWFHRVSMFYFTNRHNFTRIVCHLSRDNKIFNFMFSLFLVHARTHTCVHLIIFAHHHHHHHQWLTTRKTVRIVSSTYTLICSRDWCHIFLRLSIQRIHQQQW